MPLQAHLTKAYSSNDIDLLRSQLHDVVLTEGKELPNPPHQQVLISGRPTREQLERSPNLHSVIVPFAGIPAPTRELLLDFPQLTLYNIPYNAKPTAEMALALLFAAAKFVVPIDQALRHNDWRPRYNGTSTIILHGKTALILGYGRIGRHIAPVCRALGMDVIGVRRTVKVEGQRAQDGTVEYSTSALDALLPRADVLLIALPHTPQTEGLIDARALAALPKSAIVVNVGRGPVVEQEALYRALKEGTLLAAGIDVWYNYPKDETDRTDTQPADFPFHELPNVVMSPHRAGWLEAAEKWRMNELAVVLNALAAGQPVPNRVDVERGY